MKTKFSGVSVLALAASTVSASRASAEDYGLMAFGDEFPGWGQKNAHVLRGVDEYATRYDQGAQKQINNHFYPVPPGNYSSGLYAFHNI